LFGARAGRERGRLRKSKSCGAPSVPDGNSGSTQGELPSTQPRAAHAFYYADDRRIVVELRNGCVFGFPPELAEGLDGASEAHLAEVEVEGDGYGLHWESLDVDLTVPGILNGIFGSRVWMAELGRRGGSATSELSGELPEPPARKADDHGSGRDRVPHPTEIAGVLTTSAPTPVRALSSELRRSPDIRPSGTAKVPQPLLEHPYLLAAPCTPASSPAPSSASTPTSCRSRPTWPTACPTSPPSACRRAPCARARSVSSPRSRTAATRFRRGESPSTSPRRTGRKQDSRIDAFKNLTAWGFCLPTIERIDGFLLRI
jgi:hypothetical protein